MTYWSRNSRNLRGDGIVENSGRAVETRRRSCLKMFWQRSVQFEQMYTSLGPSTIGPTSRLVLPQNEHVVIFRPRKPPSPPVPLPLPPWPPVLPGPPCPSPLPGAPGPRRGGLLLAPTSMGWEAESAREGSGWVAMDKAEESVRTKMRWKSIVNSALTIARSTRSACDCLIPALQRACITTHWGEVTTPDATASPAELSVIAVRKSSRRCFRFWAPHPAVV